MGNHIIKQPNGKYAVWSTVVDAFTFYDATPKEILDYFIEKEVQSLTGSINKIIGELDRGEKPYFQFTMTWKEGLETQLRVHGDKANLPQIQEGGVHG